MTRDDIIKMARETGMELYGHGRDQTNFQFILCRFANAIAAAEREACAKVCDDWPVGRDDVYSIGQAIRSRGQA
jgi:hypothetical protein